MEGAAANMDSLTTQISSTMTITTHGVNEIRSPPPPLKNKGRVNHTVGVNRMNKSGLSIVSEPVKLSTAASTALSLKTTKNAPNPDANLNNNNPDHQLTKDIKRVGDFLSSCDESCHSNDLSSNSNKQCTMHECGKSHVSASPMSIAPAIKDTTHLDDMPLSASLALYGTKSDIAISTNDNNDDTASNLPITTTVDSSKTHEAIPKVSSDKSEQRYDMNMVPKVRKNPEFLQRWRPIQGSNRLPVFSSMPNLVPCDSVSNCDASTDSKSTSSEHLPCSSSDQEHHHSSGLSKSCSCHAFSNNRRNEPLNCNDPYIPKVELQPFEEDSESCIWVPSSRSDWEDCIDELVNICTAAAWHKYRQNSKKKKDFSPPISHIYVKDRLDIDDPLRGYQIRHKTGGWLQGFVMMTDFTTWTHYFKWDSNHAMNGIDRDKIEGRIDDGSLTKALESQPRSGDPHGAGVVWPTIAEISLVGALGCGEYLLQMALEDIERRGSYEFVVLEATETSRPFYEKFGFVRVGAVCKYGKKEDFDDEANGVEETGYRHWTYANESKARLNEHGGPSCMMARKILKRDAMGQSHCQSCGKEIPSFIDKLANYFVTKKPVIQPLGSAGSRKRARADTAGSLPLESQKSAKIAKTTNDTSRLTSSGRQSKTPTRLEDTHSQASAKQRSSRNSFTASLPIVPKNPIPKVSSKPILRKQKIANMYRDPKKTYYYNKVVTPKSDNTNPNKYKSKYYFVLNFEEDVRMIRIIPLYRRGTFKGKREGREKWKAVILPRKSDDDKKWYKSMDVITVPAVNWNIVPSYMVTKCSSVGEESWDILV